MLRLIINSREGEDVEADARRLHQKMLAKNNLPRIAAADRALVPSYCYFCDAPWWGPIEGTCICMKCKGEGKVKIGF